MNTATAPVPQEPTFLSEIFPLSILQPNLIALRITPGIATDDRELGNRLSFHLCRKLPEVVTTW